MKNYLFLFCLLGSVHVLFADEFERNHGNGVVHIKTDSISEIFFYASPNGEVTHRLYFTHNAWSLNRTMFSFDNHFDSLPQWFKTEYFLVNGEYARIDVTAVDSLNGYYRTTLHDSSGQEIWIRKQKHISFLNWFGFYNSVASIQLQPNDLILYDEPDAKSKQTNYMPMIEPGEQATMRALEIDGYWMKVEIRFPQHDPLLSWKTYTGWVQWRDDKQPLIRHNLMGC